MRDEFIMRFRPDIVAFVQAQARAGNHSVSDFVATILIGEKARFEEAQLQRSVQAAPELLRHGPQQVVREPCELG